MRARVRLTRSGSLRPPVSRFHSSNVCGEILPSTSSWANLRRCAWLLNGMAYRNLRGLRRLDLGLPKPRISAHETSVADLEERRVAEAGRLVPIRLRAAPL